MSKIDCQELKSSSASYIAKLNLRGTNDSGEYPEPMNTAIKLESKRKEKDFYSFLNSTNLFGIVGIGVRDGKHELRILRKAF